MIKSIFLLRVPLRVHYRGSSGVRFILLILIILTSSSASSASHPHPAGHPHSHQHTAFCGVVSSSSSSSSSPFSSPYFSSSSFIILLVLLLHLTKLKKYRLIFPSQAFVHPLHTSFSMKNGSTLLPICPQGHTLRSSAMEITKQKQACSIWISSRQGPERPCVEKCLGWEG